MKVDKETLDKIAHLARLEFDEKDSEKMIKDLGNIISFVEKLNEAYDVQIVFGKDELRNLQYTTTFDNEPLDKILSLISSTFNISVVKEKGKIILR